MIEKYIEEIQKERDYQKQKWGLTFDKDNTPHDWVTFIVKYVTRNSGGTFGRLQPKEELEIWRKDLVKTATLAIAALEWVDDRLKGV